MNLQTKLKEAKLLDSSEKENDIRETNKNFEKSVLKLNDQTLKTEAIEKNDIKSQVIIN